jgi:N-acetylneuraminate synthase
VKFQKRTVETVYSPAELARPRESPFGSTNGDLKRALELGWEEYQEIDRHCRVLGIPWFASCWDPASVDFISRFDVPGFKVASACLTDDRLLRRTRAAGRPIILSTGMSTIEQIDHAVEVLGAEELVLMHACSAYPAHYEELNLRVIGALAARYGVPVGYSGHEPGLAACIAAVALGACAIERHVTLDRAMWGSDQAISLEPAELVELEASIRAVERALGDGVKRVWQRELALLEKLRRRGVAA